MAVKHTTLAHRSPPLTATPPPLPPLIPPLRLTTTSTHHHFDSPPPPQPPPRPLRLTTNLRPQRWVSTRSLRPCRANLANSIKWTTGSCCTTTMAFATTCPQKCLCYRAKSPRECWCTCFFPPPWPDARTMHAHTHAHARKRTHASTHTHTRTLRFPPPPLPVRPHVTHFRALSSTRRSHPAFSWRAVLRSGCRVMVTRTRPTTRRLFQSLTKLATQAAISPTRMNRSSSR